MRRLERGFWFFLAYCLFAIAAGAVLQLLAARERGRLLSSGSLSETL
jgi:hypothetical protein